jgi:hypothetical protein
METKLTTKQDSTLVVIFVSLQAVIFFQARKQSFSYYQANNDLLVILVDLLSGRSSVCCHAFLLLCLEISHHFTSAANRFNECSMELVHGHATYM